MRRKIFLLFESLIIIFFISSSSALAENRVALTFDDGPSAATTPRILEILKNFGARATFFVTGANAERFPHLVRRTILEGHEIGNHTYCHFDLSHANPKLLDWQISATQAAILKITGRAPIFFRPPYSRTNTSVENTAREYGLQIVMWNISPADYLKRSPKKITESVLSGLKPGSIVVLHDFRWQTVKALEEILRGIGKMGLRAVTISELGGSK